MPDRSTVERVIASVGGRITSLLTGLLAAALIIYSGYVLYDTFYIQSNAGNSWDLLDLRPQIIEDIDGGTTPLASALADINPDYRAWLTIYDTNIDYPVMQGPNDLYYASRDIYKNTSLTGAIYLAAGNSADLSDNYNLIYGHHMDSTILFGGLDSFTETDYFSSHKTGILISSGSIYDLEIFATVKTDAYEDMVYNVGNRDLAELMEFIVANAVQYDAAAASGAEKIVAFSTCESASTSGRLVVFAKMTLRNTTPVTPGEDPTTPPAPVTPDTPPVPDNPAGPITPPVPINPGIPENVTDETTATEPSTEYIDPNSTPRTDPVSIFTPTGSTYGDRVWALVNLICVILTVYLLIPLARIKGKINRVKTLKKLNELKSAPADAAAAGGQNDAEADNEDTDDYVKKFRTKLIIGFILEIIISIIAIVVFILTEDMRLPMVLIDKWTPLMLLILLACWIADLLLIRNRKKNEEEEAQGEQDQNS